MALAATPGVDRTPHHDGAVPRIDAPRQHPGQPGDQRAQRVHQIAGQVRPRGVAARRVQRDLDLVGRRGDRPRRDRDPADLQPRIAVQREDPRHPGQRAGGDRVDGAAGHQLLGGLEHQPHADRQLGHRRQRQRRRRAAPRCARRGRRRARRSGTVEAIRQRRCARPSAARPYRRATPTRGACSGPKSQVRPVPPGSTLGFRPASARCDGDELRGGEFLTAQLRVGVDVPAPPHQIVVMRRPATLGVIRAGSCAPRLRPAAAPGPAAPASAPSATTVRANMIAPSVTARSALGPAAAAANPGWWTDAPSGIDADDRVDARHHLGDVAHIGAAQRHTRPPTPPAPACGRAAPSRRGTRRPATRPASARGNGGDASVTVVRRSRSPPRPPAKQPAILSFELAQRPSR